MAKIKTTNKYINLVWAKVFRCGYCDLQYIMRGEEPVYYNCGVYGWNYDAYCDYKRNIAITTGYRNMTGQRIPSELIEKYSKIAEEICNQHWGKDYKEKLAELEKNRENFFEELQNIQGYIKRVEKSTFFFLFVLLFCDCVGILYGTGKARIIYLK